MTVADLQQMKRDGKKIAAAVVYDTTMTRVFERAGVDFLSVGDSFASYLLGAEMDDVSVDEMLPFARAVMRTAERAVISIDVPIGVCETDAAAVGKAAKRYKDEIGPDMAKLYIPSGPERLVDQVHAVIDAGLAAYCRIPYPTEGGGIQGSPERDEHVMKWAHAVEDAGASMIDLYMGTPEIFGQVAKSVSIPVIGGQCSTDASDGKIFIYPNMLGYRPDKVDDTSGRSTAKFMLDMVQPALAEVHSGKW
jgi:3-methyl-2-oxobutanoate hydroxymethyltransferase